MQKKKKICQIELIGHANIKKWYVNTIHLVNFW